jgi:hypothetical protein
LLAVHINLPSVSVPLISTNLINKIVFNIAV